MDWLVHQRNLDRKIESDYKGGGKTIHEFKINQYMPYHTRQMSITDVSYQAVRQRTRLLAAYLDSIGSLNLDGWITAQSKLRSTVLEEFCGYLSKDLPSLQQLGLGFHGKRIFAGIRLDSAGRLRVETKDVDFCISKSVRITISNENAEIRLPAIAIECKTYVDKTMLNEAQFAAQRLKGGVSTVKVLMLAETNAIGAAEVPSQTSIDQIYILRRSRLDPIDCDTVWDLVCEVRDTLDRIATPRRLALPGKLLIR